jgi:5-methylcytosine-specific restriction endonuclease McrA
MRKALSRGKVDGAERFDPLEVLARDGWRCHICGVSTPKRLRGTFDDRAPELDHIIPLAAGGEHTRLNTACACRKCNIAKSNKPLGQLRLVA